MSRESSRENGQPRGCLSPPPGCDVPSNRDLAVEAVFHCSRVECFGKCVVLTWDAERGVFGFVGEWFKATISLGPDGGCLAVPFAISAILLASLAPGMLGVREVVVAGCYSEFVAHFFVEAFHDEFLP